MRDAVKMVPGRPPGWRDRLILLFRRRDWRGFVRLYNLLKPFAGRREIQVQTRYGTQFLTVPWDSVDNHVIREGFYESEVLEAVRPSLDKPGAVLWVIGANFGLHAITAKRLHPTAAVIAFEPSPAMADRLIENAELNQVTIEVHAYALAASVGIVRFFANASGNPGSSTIRPLAVSDYDLQFNVMTTTAAAVIAARYAPAPTAIILDAERAELEVLRGFGDTLRSPGLERIVFEAPNGLLEAPVPSELLECVRTAGFRVDKLERRETTAHDYSNFMAYRAVAASA